jgi:hypothetical protein
MKPDHTKTLALLIVGVLLVGCAHAASYNEEQMYSLAAALSKLSRAVDSGVALRGAPEGLSEEELLDFATRDDPSLREPFVQHKLHVLRQGKNSAVLVCTPDGRRALLEDAGCTGRFERHWWREDPSKSCAFTLDLAATCGAP